MRTRVFVNAGGSVSGGGKVYVLGLLEELERGGARGIEWEFLVDESLAALIRQELPGAIPLRVQRIRAPSQRFLWEQTVLPLLRRVREADVLISAANFGPLLRRRRHILIAQNILHFGPLTIRGSKGRRVRLQAALGRASARRATATVTASRTMAEAVSSQTGREAVVVPFGPGLVRGRAQRRRDRFTFVDRAMWGPHKRLADLLHAVHNLASTHADRFVVRSACDPTTAFARSFRESEADRRLLSDRIIASHVEFETFAPRMQDELDGDAVVVTSTTESFCFPLAEAIGADLPVVAADTPFARELCGEAAFYAEPGNASALADGMRRLIEGERPAPFSPEVRRSICWATHADRLASLCRSVAAPSGPSVEV